MANWFWGKEAIFGGILTASADEPTPQPSTPVPLQTRQAAQAAFPHGNRYLQLCDTLGTLYDDALFCRSVSTAGTNGTRSLVASIGDAATCSQIVFLGMLDVDTITDDRRMRALTGLDMAAFCGLAEWFSVGCQQEADARFIDQRPRKRKTGGGHKGVFEVVG